MLRMELILGGARSGKSRLAEQRVIATGLNKVYLATAQAGDAEMSQRIKHHQARRQSDWTLVEEPVHLDRVIGNFSNDGNCLLVDCLTLWLSNCLHQGNWVEQKAALLKALESAPGQIIFVSNEVGNGVVPMGELSREFIDQSGFLHQQLAALCDRVTMVVAGLPMELKNIDSAGGSGG